MNKSCLNDYVKRHVTRSVSRLIVLLRNRCPLHFPLVRSIIMVDPILQPPCLSTHGICLLFFLRHRGCFRLRKGLAPIILEVAVFWIGLNPACNSIGSGSCPDRRAAFGIVFANVVVDLQEVDFLIQRARALVRRPARNRIAFER